MPSSAAQASNSRPALVVTIEARGDRSAESSSVCSAAEKSSSPGIISLAAKQTPAAERRGSRAARSPPTRANGQSDPTLR